VKLGSLQVVDAFIRLGGTNAAAAGLRISQSAFIKALHLAEAELGVSLAVRIQGRLRPTPEARALAGGLSGSFGVLKRVHHEAAMLKAGMVGRLRIATVPGLAHSILPGAVAAVTRSKDVSPVEITFDDVAEKIRSGASEIGLSYGMSAQHRHLATIPLHKSRLVCILGPADPLASRRSINADSLRARQVISYGPEHAHEEDSFQQALIDAGLWDRIAVGIRHTDTACHLVREGCGVAVVDRDVIRSGVTIGLAVKPLERSLPIAAFAHYRKGAPLSVSATRLIEHLTGARA
jgi:DNA-binding transcriptional LysR family regulator